MRTNKKNFRLYGPQHCWDTNFHLLDGKKNIEYLIDTHDVTYIEDDDEGCLFFDTLLELDDIDEILGYAWKQKAYVSDTYRNLLSETE